MTPSSSRRSEPRTPRTSGVYGARKARAELRRKGVDMARVNAADLDGVVALYEAEAILALPGQGFAA